MEILGVITLLALISLIVIMATNKPLKDSKEELYQAQLEEIKSAAEMWKVDNIEKIPNNSYFVITLERLKSDGYIKKDIIDPRTDEQIDAVLGIGLKDILIDTLDNLLDINGYTKLSYIESTGTQYINTGVVAKQNTGFEIEFITNNTLSTSNYGCIFGARQASLNNDFQLTTYSSSSAYKGTLRFGNQSYNAGLTSATEKQHASLRNKVFESNSNSPTKVDATFETPVPITIFGLNQNGSNIQSGSVKLYSLKIYEGNTLIRDFVPARNKSTSVLGLYELVQNTFYTNNGSGTFSYGA